MTQSNPAGKRMTIYNLVTTETFVQFLLRWCFYDVEIINISTLLPFCYLFESKTYGFPTPDFAGSATYPQLLLFHYTLGVSLIATHVCGEMDLPSSGREYVGNPIDGSKEISYIQKPLLKSTCQWIYNSSSSW